MKQINCRLCDYKLDEPVLKLPDTPLANEFLEKREYQDTFPLQVCRCNYCGHYQLNETIDPERLFRHYLFVAGTSPVNVEHFRKYAVDVIERFKLKPGSRILDIASNDGTLLKHFKDLGMSVLGIDPARNLAEEATKNGIPTIPEFFTEEYANTMLKQHEEFDFITANNVFAHVPDMKGFIKGVKKLLKPGGIFSFEVSYFLDVCQNTLIDTVYHEHTSYHTVAPLDLFFHNLNMDLFYVQNIDTHGGSIRCFVRHFDSKIDYSIELQKKSTVEPMMRDEANLYNDVADLKINIRVLGLELREQLREIKSRSKSIAIYGTPAKATTLMYALGIDKSFINFAVDDAPLKQGRFTPGKHIPILHPNEIYERNPDYILVLAWNFADSIIEKCKANRYSGRFIVPLPELRII